MSSAWLTIIHVKSPMRLLFRASQKTMPKVIVFTPPPLNDEKSCQRCGRVGHIPTFCKAKYDTNGYSLDDEEEPIPQKVY